MKPRNKLLLTRKIKNKKSLKLPDEISSLMSDNTGMHSNNSKCVHASMKSSRKVLRRVLREEKKKKKKKMLAQHPNLDLQLNREASKKRNLDEVSSPVPPLVEKRKRRRKKTKHANASAKETLTPNVAMAPWEIDPLIAQEEANIRKLEKKLGLKGEGKAASQAKQKLAREMKLDGFGDDFMDFLDDLDRIADIATKPAGCTSYEGDGSCKLEAKKTKKTVCFQDEEQPSEQLTAARETPLLQKGKKVKKKAAVPENAGSSSAGVCKAPWELDPLIAQEEADIRRLEKKLGIKGQGKNAEKARQKLAREMMLDGFDEDFMDFLDDLDRIAQVVDHSKQSNSGKKGSNTQEEEFFSEEESQDDEGGNSADLPTDIDEDDEEYLSQGGSDNESIVSNSEHLDDQDSDEDIDTKACIYKPVKGQDIYGREVGAEDNSAKVKTYIPPHARSQLSTTANRDVTQDEDFIKLKRIMKGLMNRVTESNLVQIANQLKNLYQSNQTTYLNTLLAEAIEALCIDNTTVRTAMVQIYMALVSSLHYTVGSDVGGYLVEYFALKFFEEYNTQVTEKKEYERMPKKSMNLVLVISYLYEFQVINCTLVYDIVRMLIKSFSALDIELLLFLLSNCGHQLRSDDPSALKEIIILVKGQSCKGPTQSNSRVQFMLDTIMDIKNNKKRKAQEYDRERADALRKQISHFKSAKGGGRSSAAPLRVSMKDLASTEQRGRWWRVGASWAGKEDSQSLQKEETEAHSLPIALDPKQKLLMLAAKQRMNTEVRRAIFCAIMGADDYEDAFEKLLKLNLKGSQEHEIVKVLMDCCAQEKAYNPFYSHLATRICEYDNKFKFTFQLTFWDYFKQFHDAEAMPSRKCANLAHMLAHLIGNLALSLGVTRAADMSDLPPNGILFFRAMFGSIFLELTDEQFITVFDRVASAKDVLAVKENLEIFLHNNFKEMPLDWDENKRKMFKRRWKIAKGSLDAMSFLDLTSRV